MIFDAHTHAWERWPYQPAVPDPDHRGRVEQLLWEMDRNNVERAAIVCACIDGNPGNNEYVAQCVRRHADRLVQFADIDCSWSSTYHRPGAARRLAEAADRYGLRGFTHYLADDVEWFASDEGMAFFEVANARRLVASLALSPRWQPALRRLAQQFPAVTFLCHHMAGARTQEEAPQPELGEIICSAAVPNIGIKLSGFHYVARAGWEYPFADVSHVVRALYQAYGPQRLCWGSDYPVVRFFLTYQQSLEAFRTHCSFVPAADQALILGGNLARILGPTGV